MIRINLLPQKRRKRGKKTPPFILASLALLLVAVMITFYFDYFLKGKLSSLAAQKADNQRKIEMLQSKITEVQNFEKLNDTFSKRKQIIEQLRENQALPVKILDEISARLTAGVWLEQLSIVPAPQAAPAKGPHAKTQAGGIADTIQMSGFGYTNDDIVEFVQNLKDSSLFTGIYLLGTSKSSNAGVEVYTFSLTLKVKSNG
ncbi:MAG: PilN domain-containing protein [Nitrospiraceae bacterium]|nr:PilN domain-containing protein [Nitrospiraceae bacterium]